MMRLVYLLLIVVGVVLLVAFAVVNRMPVDLVLLPVPAFINLPFFGSIRLDAMTVPVSWVFLSGFGVGAIVGGLVVWLSQGSWRREARRTRNRVWALENQLGILKKQREEREAAAYSGERAIAAQGAGAA